jgi:hypothetical protein
MNQHMERKQVIKGYLQTKAYRERISQDIERKRKKGEMGAHFLESVE